ncbi:MAG TPA: ATP-binding protein [Planctomycetota bacterium]|nr:ATP-binding protein [Planctomycetota bacterium]
MDDDIRVRVGSDVEIVLARQRGRELAAQLGFSLSDQTIVATAISELARNIVLYAKRGEILLRAAEDNGRSGIVVVAQDEGPGIADLGLAMQPGNSSSGGLGLGLSGVRRLMDEFEIETAVSGTTITARKWR